MPAWAYWLVAALALRWVEGVAAQEAGKNHFFFYWPTITRQCETINLIWQNATPPIRCWIIPMGGQPFMYQINSSYYNQYGSGSYPIQLQLNYGTNYVVQMSDMHGVGSGGTAEIQQTGASPQTQCLNTASQNYTNQEFSFSVSGQAKQCTAGFDLAWNGRTEDEPYNATIVPLDQGFYPFDLSFASGQMYETDWRVNLTGGTRFTVMMNNKNGYGRGGVAGIYQVDTTTRTSCLDGQQYATTGSWPVGIATNTLPPSTISPLPSDDTSGGLSGGAIAGVVIGVIALVAIACIAAYFLLRRWKRRKHQQLDAAGQELRANKGGRSGTGLDLLEDEDEDGTASRAGLVYDPYADPQPRVDPYMSRSAAYPPSSSSLTTRDESQGMLYRGEHFEDDGGMADRHETLRDASMTDGGRSSAGFAGLGAGTVGRRSDAGSPLSAHGGGGGWGSHGYGRGSQELRHVSSNGSDAAYLAGEGDTRSGPGMAGPLPSKSSPSPVYGAAPRVSPAAVPGREGPGQGIIPSRSPPAGQHAGSPPFAQAGGKGSAEIPRLAQPAPLRHQGPFQLANPDHPDQLPAVPPSVPQEISPLPPPRRSGQYASEQPRFRRHQDAGRAEEIVDLPPLYTEVPHDGPRPFNDEGEEGIDSPARSEQGQGRR